MDRRDPTRQHALTPEEAPQNERNQDEAGRESPPSGSRPADGSDCGRCRAPRACESRPEAVGKVARRLKALLRLLLETMADRCREVLRNLRPGGGQMGWVIAKNRGERLGAGSARECPR